MISSIVMALGHPACIEYKYIVLGGGLLNTGGTKSPRQPTSKVDHRGCNSPPGPKDSVKLGENYAGLSARASWRGSGPRHVGARSAGVSVFWEEACVRPAATEPVSIGPNRSLRNS